MAQGPSDTILVVIRITLRIREFKVRNPDPPDRRSSLSAFLVTYYFSGPTAAFGPLCVFICVPGR